MSIAAWIIIAVLVTALLVKCHKTVPALVAGLITGCLVLAAFPALGPALGDAATSVSQTAGDATERAADVQ